MLVGFVGIQGQGKTLSMTAFGIMTSIFTVSKLYSHHTLFDVDYEKIHNVEELFKIKKGIVLLDELWITLDSRAAMKRENRSLTKWLQQTRKKDLMVFYTTQLFSQVDYRLRQATQWVVSCTKNKNGIYLTFVNVPTQKIGRKLLISSPEKFYKTYDTNEAIEPLDFEGVLPD